MSNEIDYEDIARRMEGTIPVTDEDMILLFQHYIDTDTLPKTAKHQYVAQVMREDGVLHDRIPDPDA